jgi:acyl carrier protein
MTLDKELIELISRHLKDLESDLGTPLDNDPDAETALFGEGGRLDSMGLVTLVLDVEQAIQDRFGKAISLADEKAMSQRHSPYATVGSLANYAQSVLDRAG